MAKSRSKHLDKYPVLINWWNHEEIPINKLAEQWGMQARDVGRLVHNVRTSDTIYRELVKTYEDGEIAPWVMRPGGELPSEYVKDDEVPSKDGEAPSDDEYQAPKSRKPLVQEQGPTKTPDRDLTALTKTDPPSPTFTEDDLAYLTSLNITPMQDGSERWMQVVNQPDGARD